MAHPLCVRRALAPSGGARRKRERVLVSSVAPPRSLRSASVLVRRCAALALPLAAVVALGGCSGSSGAPSDGGEAAASAAASTSAVGAAPVTDSPTGCGGDGPGIVRTECDGSAVVSFTIDGEEGEIAGGSCDTTVAYLEVVAGTLTGDGWELPRLDFVDLLLPVEDGDFTDAEIQLIWDGVEATAPDATGTHDAASGSFAANLADGRSLRGTFSC